MFGVWYGKPEWEHHVSSDMTFMPKLYEEMNS